MPTLTFEIDVELSDGRQYQVVADQRDVAKWEVQPNGWPVIDIDKQFSMTFCRYIAFSASLRYGKFVGTLEQWNELCVEAMPIGDEDEPGKDDPAATIPGPPAASDTPLSPSAAPPVSRSKTAASKRGTRVTLPR